MIVKPFNTPLVVYQECGEGEMPNEALLVDIDNGDTPCIRQRDQCIVLNRLAIPDLIKALKALPPTSDRGAAK